MELTPVDLGFSVADGEKVEVSFAGRDLVLRFVDWREQRVEHRFVETLAFRWSARPSVVTPRDDATYSVSGSTWLCDEVRLDGYSVPDEFSHYVLCFNAAKVLEVISRNAA